MPEQFIEAFWLEIEQYGTTSFKKCPLGGYCFNPLCMLGCIEKAF